MKIPSVRSQLAWAAGVVLALVSIVSHLLGVQAEIQGMWIVASMAMLERAW